jgi:ArsR family transcriptional regulator
MHHNGFEAKICVMDRLRYGPCWRNKKAEVGQSIYKATLSNGQSSSR